MDFIKNIPFFCIVLSMTGGIISSILKKNGARYVNLVVNLAVILMSGVLLVYVCQTGVSFTFSMGVYPAPWGNEVRSGILEAVIAFHFSIIMLLCIMGGSKYLKEDIPESKLNLYYVFADLLLGAILALIYTNDLFTAYVFIEINTIAACGLIMLRGTGQTYLAALRYMIMNLIGSGIFLFAISILYSITGQLLMVNAHEMLEKVVQTGTYAAPFFVVLAMMTIGLAVKSGLFPFHYWMPGAYSFSTTSTGAILSGLVSKTYIFLLIKLFVRVIGMDIIRNSKILNILFVLGITAMILGSVKAMFEKDIRRMNAYSSVAQIGYIFMGIGLGTTAGMVAALFHMLAHSNAKALLFVSSGGLVDARGGSGDMSKMVGLGYYNKVAGAAFTAGALSLVGIPLFGGFVSKMSFASAALESPGKVMVTVIALAVSTLLNAMYFLRTVITIYTPVEREEVRTGEKLTIVEQVKIPAYQGKEFRTQPVMAFAMGALVVMNFVLGIGSVPIIDALRNGLEMFG